MPRLRAYGRVALGFAATAAAAVAVLAGCGDDAPTAEDTRAEQMREALAGSGLSAAVVDVLALAAAGTEGTYRVVYDLTTTDGGTQRVELTQRPPDRRLDVTNPDGTADATIAAGGTFHQCHRDDTWACSEIGPTPAATGGALDDGAVGRLADSLAADTDRYDLTVEPRRLVGVEATCLVARLRPGVAANAGEGAEGTLCVSPEGAMLLTERPSELLQAVDYSADVADDAFTLPA